MPNRPAAALFDATSGVLSLEFGAEDDSLMCNVPIVEEWRVPLSMEDSLLLGSVVNGVVSAAERIPLRSLL